MSAMGEVLDGQSDRIAELERKLKLADERYEQLVAVAGKREAELGAENATLRENVSALWQRWADALWHGDDATRPLTPADASQMDAWEPLAERLHQLFADGLEELQAERAKHTEAQHEAAASIFALTDKLSEKQAAEGGL